MTFDTNDTVHHLAAMSALVWVRFNQTAEVVLDMAYGDADAMHPDYREEKAEIWQSCPLTFISQLDGPNSVRFWQACMNLYADDAYRSAHYAMASVADLATPTPGD